MSSLYWAVDKENIEIVKLLLTNDKLDINRRSVFLNVYKIQNHIINWIHVNIFQ